MSLKKTTQITAPSGRRAEVMVESSGAKMAVKCVWLDPGATAEDYAWGNENIPPVAADLMGIPLGGVRLASGDARALKAAAAEFLYGGGNN
jgi:hypothetical protein